MMYRPQIFGVIDAFTVAAGKMRLLALVT